MGAGDNILYRLDQAVTNIVGEWDIYSTVIFGSIIAFFAYQVFTSRDPDIHPMLLARQSQASPVRQEGQSSVFRSHSAPHGIPLHSGLQVKDAGDSKWSRGRDGDLRDVWKRVVSGGVDLDGKPNGEIGKIMTVLGKEQIQEHDLSDITRQINIVGQQIKQNGGKNVAIYLPNSIELLAALFASAFYDLTAILLPYDQPLDTIISQLKESKTDAVIAAVGSFPFDIVTRSYPALKQLIWVVDEGSKHMDWNEVPEGAGSAVNVCTWQQIIQDQETAASTEIPVIDRTIQPNSVFAYWPSGELVEYTQANIIAGIAGQLTSIPSMQRIKHTDLFLPVESLWEIYTLVVTLAALYSNASVALNSVAGRTPDLVLATQGISPTVIVAGPDTLLRTHTETTRRLTSSLYGVVHWFQRRSLVQNGVLPVATAFSRAFDHLRPNIGTTSGKLRLVFVSEQIGAKSTPLSAEVLSDLRIYTGARFIYALTAAKVAGAITQTSLYDYRVDESSEKYSHFGVPVTSVEIYLKDTQTHKTSDEFSSGEIYARGPAVVGGEAALGATGRIRDDHTLALA